MNVLGIETSCDETGVAIYGDTANGGAGVLAHQLYSQVDLHQAYGGVVPEMASRDHIRKLLPLIQKTIRQSSLNYHELSAIAYTNGPGLIGGLFVGAMLSTSLAYAWGLPTIRVHHMEGHLLAPLMGETPPDFPFVALLVSGGHSQLLLAKSLGEYQLLGDTLDDAVGEVFDKVASLLSLPYPGGPALERLAKQCSASKWRFPRPMVDRPGLDLSFSGLKTYCRNWCDQLKLQNEWHDKTRAETAYAFQAAVIDTLVIKCLRALKQTGVKRLVVAGGVSANQSLKQQLTLALDKVEAKAWFPELTLCTDNGAMIAYAGWRRLQQKFTAEPDFLDVDVDVDVKVKLDVKVKPRWPLSDLSFKDQLR